MVKESIESLAHKNHLRSGSRVKTQISRENGNKRPAPVTDSATFTTPEAGDEDLGDLLLEVLPPDGSTIGNLSAREALVRMSRGT